MAKKQWSKQELILLNENYALYGWQWVQAELKLKFGTERSQRSIQSQAVKKKCCREVFGKWYTIKEICLMLSLDEATIKRAIYKGCVNARKANNVWLLAESALHYFKKAYPSICNQWVPTSWAAQRIGVTESALIRAIERGSIECVSRGRFYFIHQDYVQHIIQSLKQTGNVRVMWDKLRRNYEQQMAA